MGGKWDVVIPTDFLSFFHRRYEQANKRPEIDLRVLAFVAPLGIVELSAVYKLHSLAHGMECSRKRKARSRIVVMEGVRRNDMDNLFRKRFGR